MKYLPTLILLLAALNAGFSQTLPSIWRLPYTTGFLQFNVVFEFCADGRVTVMQTGPGTLPSCQVCDWWRFGDEIFIKSTLSEMTATINESNPDQPFLQNIQLTQTNDILLLYPANTQPDAFFYPVSLAQLAAYKQIAGCPVVPPCTLTDWSSVSAVGELQTKAPDLLVSPNPVQDQLYIQLPEGAAQPLKFQLTDSNGRVVLHSDTPQMPLTLDMSHLSNGLYCLQAIYHQGIITQSILKI